MFADICLPFLKMKFVISFHRELGTYFVLSTRISWIGGGKTPWRNLGCYIFRACALTFIIFYLSAGIVIEEKNWPPFFPLIHHDISNEIPIHLQRMQYLAFSSFLGKLLSVQHVLVSTTVQCLVTLWLKYIVLIFFLLCINTLIVLLLLYLCARTLTCGFCWVSALPHPNLLGTKMHCCYCVTTIREWQYTFTTCCINDFYVHLIRRLMHFT